MSSSATPDDQSIGQPDDRPVGQPIRYPERVSLARLPTPLEHLARTSEVLGVPLYIKRDDLTGVALSGNKVRKLEYLFADARAQGADTIISCGGEQSNHCRAVAVSAARVGMHAHLLLRTADPARPPADTGNILLDRLVGADIQWIDMAGWRERAALMAAAAEDLRGRGRIPYIIPEGGSNAVGSWGYVRAAEELAEDLRALDRAALEAHGPDDERLDIGATRTTIVYAAGSGGTGAGLLLGARLCGLLGQGLDIVGICACDDKDYFQNEIARICADFDARYESLLGTRVGIERADIEIIDDYIGLGYGRTRPEEVAVARDLARREGIILDPTYTGKAFYGLTRELAENRQRFADRVVFVHTGGLFRLFQ